MLKAKCHCGAILIRVNREPDSLTSCNCSLCKRYGSLWAYFTKEEVVFDFERKNAKAYFHGDRNIEFFHLLKL